MIPSGEVVEKPEDEQQLITVGMNGKHVWCEICEQMTEHPTEECPHADETF